MDVRTKPNYGEVSREAAGLVADALRANPDLTLALPTGRTPLGMYAELVRLHTERHLDFSRARIFSLDEYVGLAPSDPRKFHNYLWANFLTHIDVRPENVTLAPASGGPSADAYEHAIKAAGGFDLLIAGLGANGHIAFNEPGSSFHSRTRVVDLAEPTLAAVRNAFEDSILPRQAVTIGIATILEARRILLLVSGASKKRALHHVLNGPVTENVPGSALRLHSTVTLIADRETLQIGL